MTRSDMERVQTYLRGLLGSDRIRVVPPAKPGLTVEVAVNDEVVQRRVDLGLLSLDADNPAEDAARAGLG